MVNPLIKGIQIPCVSMVELKEVSLKEMTGLLNFLTSFFFRCNANFHSISRHRVRKKRLILARSGSAPPFNDPHPCLQPLLFHTLFRQRPFIFSKNSVIKNTMCVTTWIWNGWIVDCIVCAYLYMLIILLWLIYKKKINKNNTIDYARK